MVSVLTNFIVKLSESKGQTQIYIAVDRFTKMTHIIGLKERAMASDVGKACLENVRKIHGLPKDIVSD